MIAAGCDREFWRTRLAQPATSIERAKLAFFAMYMCRKLWQQSLKMRTHGTHGTEATWAPANLVTNYMFEQPASMRGLTGCVASRLKKSKEVEKSKLDAAVAYELVGDGGVGDLAQTPASLTDLDARYATLCNRLQSRVDEAELFRSRLCYAIQYLSAQVRSDKVGPVQPVLLTQV